MPRAFHQSPIGTIEIVEWDGTIASITIGTGGADSESNIILDEAVAQISAYFSGALTRFTLPLAPSDTPKGPSHRAAIVHIPFGETASYGELARRLGSSPRAVGQACRRNPLPIIVPCHRVLASGGAIGHYSGGDGIATKRWLLDHESRR